MTLLFLVSQPLLSPPDLIPESSIELSKQKGYRGPVDNLKLQRISQVRKPLAVLITGKIIRPFHTHKIGHSFLGESHLFAESPEIVFN